MSTSSAALYSLIATTSITGTVTLAITFLVMRKADVYKTPYGVMMQARCCHGILFLLYFLSFVSPLNWHKIYPEMNKWTRLVFVFLTTAVFITSALVSILRFINVSFPFTGDKKYRKHAKYVNLVVVLISAGYTSFYISEECRLYFNPEVFAFSFPLTACGERLALYGDFLSSLILFNVALFFDITTVRKLRKNRYKLARSISCLQMRRRHRREISLTVQTFLNASLCSLMVITYHVLPDLVTIPPFLVVLLSSRYLWCFVIASGGYFSLIFDKEVRKFIRTKIFCWPATRRVTQVQPTASPAPVSAENAPYPKQANHRSV